MDIGELGGHPTVVRAASEADLTSAGDIRSADVVVVNGGPLRMPTAVALVTDRLATL